MPGILMTYNSTNQSAWKGKRNPTLERKWADPFMIEIWWKKCPLGRPMKEHARGGTWEGVSGIEDTLWGSSWF